MAKEDSNDEILGLLDKLKDIAVEDKGKVEKPPEPEVEEVPDSKPGMKAGKGEKPKKSFIEKIEELEKDILEKEKLIDTDLEKLRALIEELERREVKLKQEEETAQKKNKELTRRLEDIKKAKEVLKGIVE
ncbi:MAG: hypothetical protein JXB14_01600 [Candidatus Altiarchaeota archaeon]|nr:hypothetical protein [Candidatus Altiarchaeota archaeon]